MIFGLIRLLLPFVVIYFVYKFFKKKVGELTGVDTSGTLKKSSEQDVIEICPQCGYEKGRRHRCKNK